MREFQIELRQNNCANLRGLNDVQELAKTLHQQGFLATDPAKNFEIAENIDEIVGRYWEPSPLWEPQKPFVVSPLYRIGFGVIPKVAEDVIASFGCEFWGLDHSLVRVGGLIDFEFTNQYSKLEPFAQSLKDLAILFYERLKPSFAYVDEAEGMGRGIKEAVKGKLKVLGWINIFGPPFVEKYGRDFLLNLPGHELKQLGDGGIYHQLTPGILVATHTEARRIQNEVELYCAEAGMKVACTAPYCIQI